MNIKTIIVGSLAIALAIGGTFIKMTSEETQAVYTPRTLNNGGITGQAGYAAYMHMLKADPATGEIDYDYVQQIRNEIMAKAKLNNKALLGLNWTQMGPDNVGGRTRAILVDQANSNVVYAGGVSGGLFVSTDGTQTWTPVTGMQGVLGENLSVTCITQTDNGRIFFGTGTTFEGSSGFGGSGFIGNGVYEYVPATGAVLTVIQDVAAPANFTSSGGFWTVVNAIASYGNRLYLGTKDGMVWADPDGSGFYPTTFAGWFNPIEVIPGLPEAATCQDIDVASDGSMLVCFAGKAYVSNQSDALGAFTRFLNTDGNAISGSRLSGAIAPSDPNVMYVVGSSGVLTGLHITRDKGVNVNEIVPGGAASIDPFRRDAASTGGQGGYDDAIAVDPSDWGHILVGGIRLFEWRYATGSNPIGGSWLLAATLGGAPFGVHADIQTFAWPSTNTVYVGSDGGVTRSVDGGMTWQERNYGYNVTSFYDVATAGNGWVVGGAQDNGDLIWSNGTFGLTSPYGANTLFPTDGQTFGDGFDVAFSNQGPGIVYATAQFGALWRTAASIGGGGFFDPELADLIATGSAFHTVIENWESDYDVTSVDSITMYFTDSTGTAIAPQDTVYAGQTINAGDTIWYESLTNANPLMYIVPANIVLNTPGDSIKLQDPIQNRFAMVANNYVYVTRDAARLGSATGAVWHRVADSPNAAGALVLEFSANGNDLYIGRSNSIVRVSGLNLANDSLGLDVRSPSNVLTTTSSTGISGTVTGIAADPNDLDNLIVTTGGYTTGNHVYRCTNGTTGLSFTAIQGGVNALPRMPVYDAVINYTDNDKVIVGTEWGVWTTDNAFSAAAGALVEWTDESGNGMTHTPVHGVVQQHLFSNNSTNTGCIYLGTHGRGFYRSCDLASAVSVEENEWLTNDNGFATNLNVYPNPLNNVGVLVFDLKENKETTVKIFNLTGSLVKTIKLGALAKGNHKVKFDVSSLSVGSYIISLESGSERSVAKFIVTR